MDRNLSEPELYAQLIKRTIPLGNSPKLEGSEKFLQPLNIYQIILYMEKKQMY
jgi:hypothetical protein